jgi:hypothetical protein
MNQSQHDKQDMVAQWSFDTRPILGRFHLWLEDVEVRWSRGQPIKEFFRPMSFLDGRMERLLAMTAAVTAMGTQVFGRFGAGTTLDKAGVNQVKKDADAISAYAMSESLWYLSRQLPENHAIMVSLGEGLMPKGGETPEMGSNPQLGFGRVYARPEVARWLDQRVVRLLNDESYGWEPFYREIKESGITVWGAAIDTLENTSRFAMGSETGPMTVLHLFDQPLHIIRPYEGYMGNLFLPREVVDVAADHAILIDFRTPRALVAQAIELAYPGIKRENIHVWTLGGKSRAGRIGKLWKAWADEGVHVVEDGWELPDRDEGLHRFWHLCADIQHRHMERCRGRDAPVASATVTPPRQRRCRRRALAPMLDLDASLVDLHIAFRTCSTTSEQRVMRARSEGDSDFAARLEQVLDGAPVEPAVIARTTAG